MQPCDNLPIINRYYQHCARWVCGSPAGSLSRSACQTLRVHSWGVTQNGNRVPGRIVGAVYVYKYTSVVVLVVL